MCAELFDGRRLWLVDWESAYRNDPMVDLATLIDSFEFSPELEAVLAKTWLGRVPDDAFFRRLATVRALTHLYFAGVFLSGSAASRTRTAPIPICRSLRSKRSKGVVETARLETVHPKGCTH